MTEQATAGELHQPGVPEGCPTCGQPTGDDAAKAHDPGGDARHVQRRLAAIARAASSVADAGSLRVTLDVVAREVVQAEHIAAAQILRVEHPTMQIVGKAGFTDAEDFTDRLEECRKLGARMMFVEAFRTRQRIVVPHRKQAILDDPKWAPLHAIMGAPEWDSFVAVPLVVRGRAVGVLNAYYEPGETPGPSALEFLEAMADQAATAVDSADLLVRGRRDAQLDERARLARELHDSVVQHVFSMRMQAKALRAQVEPGRTSSSERVRSVADELLGLAQHALADLRGLVLQLHPTELVGRGLVAAVREHAESVQAATGLAIDVSTDEPWLVPELPTELQEDLYRIVQEALHNVVKHACASRALVRISTVDGLGGDQLLVEISDDGKGWQPTQERRGALGLVSMKERAQRWGGHMAVDNADGGCRVRVRLPAAHGGGR
ncbi:GAF domain-containing sensor histidine kinase [Saccharopolyspora sp. K220]|uniref:GAF domain-containing sensor histidine kinase n=1 Tax=Saccharopolyspora soli TaxID=2926618 RepID=UPI001F5797D8|nr:GAF domain-containing sensor histidine kinase [Saccharopolyspora soli]MCI2416525.1 GAF domain-containing sensor histidine kinase [Saccharopolyspora soli]